MVEASPASSIPESSVDASMKDRDSPTAPVRNGAATNLKGAKASFEADYIRSALAKNDGNVSRTARALGVSRVTLQKKLRELGIR
jgi:DNA-binding NtrC family response regulator